MQGMLQPVTVCAYFNRLAAAQRGLGNFDHRCRGSSDPPRADVLKGRRCGQPELASPASAGNRLSA
jgi:hypothetical protein